MRERQGWREKGKDKMKKMWRVLVYIHFTWTFDEVHVAESNPFDPFCFISIKKSSVCCECKPTFPSPWCWSHDHDSFWVIWNIKCSNIIYMYGGSVLHFPSSLPLSSQFRPIPNSQVLSYKSTRINKTKLTQNKYEKLKRTEKRL